jgi:hypothetical protein
MDDEPNNLNEEFANNGLNSIPLQKRALFEDDYSYSYDDSKLLPKFYIDQNDLFIYDKLGIFLLSFDAFTLDTLLVINFHFFEN